jgi:hypothetical protein
MTHYNLIKLAQDTNMKQLDPTERIGAGIIGGLAARHMINDVQKTSNRVASDRMAKIKNAMDTLHVKHPNVDFDAVDNLVSARRGHLRATRVANLLNNKYVRRSGIGLGALATIAGADKAYELYQR